MKQYPCKVLFLLLTVMFLGSGGLTLRQAMDYAQAEISCEQARTISGIAPDEVQAPVELPEPELPPEDISPLQEPLEEDLTYLLETDLSALQQVNEDVLGWICIPDTPLSYPLLQAEDNQTYLTRAWDRTPNSGGSVFLECKSSPDFSDFNTIVYGHRMKNDSIFGSLRYYRDQAYLESHPCVYIVTAGDVRRYEIFSAYEAPVVSSTYRLYIEDAAGKQAALEYFVSSSVLESVLTPTVDDQILTLSTCTGTGTYHSRWVVQAVLTACWERPS